MVDANLHFRFVDASEPKRNKKKGKYSIMGKLQKKLKILTFTSVLQVSPNLNKKRKKGKFGDIRDL